ncbi:MAG TPA: hypothetical protein VF435_08245, partial [Pyrinomonadaceae bacterium]
MINKHFTTLCILLSLATISWAQTPEPSDVHVKLSLAENKTVYRIGEPIRLVMEFTADREGYVIEVLPDTDGPMSDTISVSPEMGVTQWFAELTDNRYPGRCVLQTEKLSAPRRLEIVLNDSLRFDNPGRYTVSVKTRRVSRPSTDVRQPSESLSLSTNVISFEVQSMNEADEAKEVKRLSDLLDATRNSRDYELARRLSYLTGDPSTREKVRRFLNAEQQSSNNGVPIYYGLFIARNRGLVLKLIETAMRDPNTPVTSQMLGAAIRLRMLITYGISPKPAGPSSLFLQQPEENPRNREIREAYVTELAAGLGKRSGNSQTVTALTLLAVTPQGSPAESASLGEVRRILVQHFDTLHPYSQEWLLSSQWERLRDVSLVPSLKKMLAPTNSASKNLHASALKRLLEMAPHDARSYVVAEILDPNSLVDPQILGALKEESLPEVDASLLEQIRKLAQSADGRSQVFLRAKTAVLVRFATDNIYGELMQLYQQTSNLPRDGRAGLLAYFAKHNDREAGPLIEQAVAELKPGEYPQILSDMTALYYSESM